MPQHPLQRVVHRIRQSWNRRVTLELFAWAIAWGLALFWLAAWFDYTFRFVDRGLRVLLSAALATGLLWLGWSIWSWWQRRRWSEFHAASNIQRAFPDLGDRLTSAIEFLRQDESEGPAGSAAMRRAVILQATAEVAQLPVQRVASNSRFHRALMVGLVAAAVTTALVLWRPHTVRTAIARLAMPWSDVEWPRQHSLEFREPPALIARGHPFEVALVDTQGSPPEDTRIEYRYQLDGRRRDDSEPMQRVGDTMVARREKVTRDFAFRAVGGDHRSMPWHEVKVVDPPTLDSLELIAHPPGYSGLTPRPLDGPARLLPGSSLAVEGVSATPLTSAELIVDDDHAIPIELPTPTQVRMASGQWHATLSDNQERLVDLSLRLTGEKGLVGRVPAARFRIVVDPPPQVTWREPAADLYVLASAIVPVTAEVSDNLAIAQGELQLEFSMIPGGSSTAEGSPREAAPQSRPLESISLYDREVPPALDQLPATGMQLDEQELTTELQLAELDMPPGSVVSLNVVATDFRPGKGRTASPRRITIISPAELELRLASQRSELLRMLEQALNEERTAREQSIELVAANPTSGAELRNRIDGFARTRTAQRKIRTLLAGPSGSVLDLIAALRRQVKMNRIERGELLSQLDSIEQDVARLDSGPLPSAEQLLTDLRKELETAQTSPADRPLLAEGGRQLDAAQLEVITTLERLVEQVAGWSDADRFVRELGRLEALERELADATAKAAVRQAQARAQGEQLRKDEFDRLIERQTEATRNAEKLLQSMRQMANEGISESDFAQRLADAVAEADRQQLTRNMADAAQQAERGQLGRAADAERVAAEQLADLLRLLKDDAPSDPDAIASELRKLQSELAQAERELQQATGEGERQALADQLKRLARKLERMTASAASQSTQQAASQTAPQPGETAQQKAEQHEQARQNLKRAQEQLAERLEELEQQRQQRLLERLAVFLEQLIPEQQLVLEQTLQLEDAVAGDLNRESRRQPFEELAASQAELADQLSNAIADLAARAVFQLSLRGAEEDMRHAAASIEQGDPGHLTQQLELAALARMRHVLEVLRDPPPAPEEPQENQQGEGNQGDQQQQRPPIIELAEAKMLRWLQVELNSRTRLYEADLADNPQQKAVKSEVARRLAEEQQQLEQLVREMMERRRSPERELENL